MMRKTGPLAWSVTILVKQIKEKKKQNVNIGYMFCLLGKHNSINQDTEKGATDIVYFCV